MEIRFGKEKIKIVTASSFKERFKSLRFYLKPLDYCLYFPKKKSLNTYFFCQRVDVFITDENRNILYIYPNLKSEKIIFWKRKAKEFYLLPVGASNYYEVGDKLRITS